MTAQAEDNPLIPEGEAELMDKHPLSLEKSYFKPGTGLVLTSEDERFQLAPRLRVQYLYVMTAEDQEDPVQRLQIRRARIQFKGYMFNKNNKFKAEFAFSPNDVGMKGAPPTQSPLLDFYVDFAYLRDLTLRVGQYKVPHNRQRVVSSGDQQLVDRSIVNSEFTIDRDIGMDLRSKDLFGVDMLRYYAGAYMGMGRNNNQDTDMGMTYLARVEFLPFGMFKDYKEADFARTGPRLSLGGGYAMALTAPRDEYARGDVPADGGTTDIQSVTWDAVFKVAGFSLVSEWIYRVGTRTPGDLTEVDDAGAEVAIATAPARDGIGGMVQSGYLLPGTRFEIAGRWGQVRPIGDASPVSVEDEYGGGLSYYFAQHPLKLQGDYFYLTEEATGEAVVTENRVRVQLQAAF